ncbi:LysR family transcriptional regulator [Nevskia ramosa]|uniref:LysR family transcriptional regulator n=1 Tax=Nevskia ramosa TaxID=64002 RepID=UPI0003B4E65B|nr:LysR family transcriptional regulator [Nevskia ramosa]
MAASSFMDFRRLSCFVAVVEQRSFRAAALKLHISQPPLTRHVQMLESALGVQLLVRSAGGIEPTAAGKLFYEEARNLLMLAQQAGERVRLAGQGRIGRLDIGVFGSAVLGAIPKIVHAFRDSHPKVELVLHNLDRASQIKALRERRISVGFNRYFADESDLRWEVIQTERMHVVLPSQHRLAGRRELSLADIGQEPLILYPRAPRPGFIDEMMRLFSAQRITPNVAHEIDDMVTAIGLVASGFGLSLLTDSGCNLRVPGTVQIPLRKADRATVNLCMIHRRDEDDSSLLQAFLETARSLRASLDGVVDEPEAPSPAAPMARLKHAVKAVSRKPR